MIGCDVSGWNTIKQVKAQNPDFLMIKASEGVNYKSDGLDTFYNWWSGKTDGKPAAKPYGFYHYARPETGNTPEAEAKSFLSYVGHHAGHAVFALDWEDKALTCAKVWALKWLDYVAKETGSLPLLYCSSSVTRQSGWQEVAAKYPIWVAAYTGGMSVPPNLGTWSRYVMWQYTSTPLDMDYFPGTMEEWQQLVTGTVKRWQVRENANSKILMEYTDEELPVPTSPSWKIKSSDLAKGEIVLKWC